MKRNCLDLLLQRHSCRFIQHYVDKVSKERLIVLLKSLQGNELMVVMDQNANHVIQHIVSTSSPDVFYEFFIALLSNPKGGIETIANDKYGCRVIQKCLERIVEFCTGTEAKTIDSMQMLNGTMPNPNCRSFNYSFNHDCFITNCFSAAANLLSTMIKLILPNAAKFMEHECANYVIQFIIESPPLEKQRTYIIKNYIM